MRLEYLYLDGYKGLKNLAVHFEEQSAPAAVHFLIGRNGSGKSSLLEAIGLIFTRIMQNELPGFQFEIKYSMPQGARICIKPQKAGYRDGHGRRRKLFVEVEKAGERIQYETLPDEYLPDRIISYCSGANSSMEEILVSSPRDSLACDLYDLAVLEAEDPDREFRKDILNFYEKLLVNPRVLYLDAVTSKFILPVLFAVLPLDMQSPAGDGEWKEYCRKRGMLTARLSSMELIPASFSFCVNDEMLARFADSPQIGILSRLIDRSGNKDGSINDWVVNRASADKVDRDGSMAAESAVVFLYSKLERKDEQSYYHPGLQQFFAGNPFVLLSTLLTAYREGVISSVHFSFRKSGEQGLYDMEALSDGELMWLARTGLILMAQGYCGKNTLFLFDEPDVHFNDDWNKDFIKLLYELSEGTQHEFLIATHSTLILTDAMYEQLNLFENQPGRKTEVKGIDISTFAAQRDEISRQVFGAGSIGTYAADSVRDMMHETDPERMKENIEKLGPGYQRFRLYKQFYSLTDEQ